MTRVPALCDPFASQDRPVLSGRLGAVSAAHPLAVAAGQEMLHQSGTAVDAAIAAQAVLCVVAPDACGIGGDAMCLVRTGDGTVTAVQGCGPAPQGLLDAAGDGGASVTVPGAVGAWDEMATRWGRLPLSHVLAPAIRLARGGMRMGQRLARAITEQRPRLERGGAGAWPLLAARPGEIVDQLELANLLDRVVKEGASALYGGSMAEAICAATQASGGAMTPCDLAAFRVSLAEPLGIPWHGARLLVQPPPSQGILLAMAASGLERLGPLPEDVLEHAGIELTEASFGLRDRVGEGASLLRHPLPADLARASRRGGPRAYLHTAGAATSDRDGAVVSSLVSVFDDFGSGVFVPEGGFVLNNRAGGFTTGPNRAAPGKLPVHTLAPILLETARGPLGFATPGADGQVQTLLQVLCAMLVRGHDLAASVRRPRWRSENGQLLIEADHIGADALRALGHAVTVLEAGHMKSGAVVCAGLMDGGPVCVADWRRETWSGVA